MNEVKMLHRQAMSRVDDALEARRNGHTAQALTHFHEAFDLESRAAALVAADGSAEPTRSVLLRSAASLALDCNLERDAERLICMALSGNPPEAIAEELRDLLETVHFERHLRLRGITLQTEEFQVSINGDSIGYGIAPSEEFLDRVEKAQRLLYRTAERKQGKPFRDRGRRPRAIEEGIQLFMTVPRAASFAVTLRVGSSQQLVLPGMSFAEDVVDELFTCLDMFSHADEVGLRGRIPQAEYLTNFVGLAREISPDGREVRQVGFTLQRAGLERTVSLTAPRNTIRQILLEGDQPEDDAGSEVRLVGQLKAADSRTEGKDKITIVDGKNRRHAVSVPSGLMSDVVKPHWGEQVTIVGRRKGRVTTLIDITPTDPSYDPSE